MKLAIVSHVLPPSSSGQSVILYRLLRTRDASSYCLISVSAQAAGTAYQPLPAKYHQLPRERRVRGAGRLRLLGAADIAFRVWQRARNVARIVREERCDAILACSGDLIDLPAAYRASRACGVLFYAYMFDDYVSQWTNPLERRFARRAEGRFAPDAAGVIVPNEFLRDAYARRHGIAPAIVRNAFEGEVPSTSEPSRFPQHAGLTLVYTGAVYHANADAFRNLLRALEARGGAPGATLHLYTDQSPAALEQLGVRGDRVVHHAHVAPRQALEVQRDADILFLPLGFHTSIPEVIDTSAPGKMAEYMLSGRPILVHAPATSFAAWYFRTHRCGLVVDRDDPAALASAIQRLTDSVELGAELARNAEERAHADFDITVARACFRAATGAVTTT